MFFLNIFMSLSLLLSIMFMINNHPMMLMLILIFQTMNSAILLGMMSNSFWYSYIMFLIFVGSMLILFMYMIAMIYNKKMNMPYMSVILLLIISIFLIKMNKYFNLEINSYLLMYSENSNFLKNLYEYPNNMISLFILSYLFFLMVVVEKITMYNNGPLRVMK